MFPPVLVLLSLMHCTPAFKIHFVCILPRGKEELYFLTASFQRHVLVADHPRDSLLLCKMDVLRETHRYGASREMMMDSPRRL